MHLAAHVCLLHSGTFYSVFTCSFYPPPHVCIIHLKSGVGVAVRLMSPYATQARVAAVVLASASLPLRRGRLRGDLFPPDCPLCHSNVHSSWVTSPPPTRPSHSLPAFCLSEWRPHCASAVADVRYFATRFCRRWSSLDTREREFQFLV